MMGCSTVMASVDRIIRSGCVTDFLLVVVSHCSPAAPEVQCLGIRTGPSSSRRRPSPVGGGGRGVLYRRIDCYGRSRGILEGALPRCRARDKRRRESRCSLALHIFVVLR